MLKLYIKVIGSLLYVFYILALYWSLIWNYPYFLTKVLQSGLSYDKDFKAYVGPPVTEHSSYRYWKSEIPSVSPSCLLGRYKLLSYLWSAWWVWYPVINSSTWKFRVNTVLGFILKLHKIYLLKRPSWDMYSFPYPFKKVLTCIHF